MGSCVQIVNFDFELLISISYFKFHVKFRIWLWIKKFILDYDFKFQILILDCEFFILRFEFWFLDFVF